MQNSFRTSNEGFFDERIILSVERSFNSYPGLQKRCQISGHTHVELRKTGFFDEYIILPGENLFYTFYPLANILPEGWVIPKNALFRSLNYQNFICQEIIYCFFHQRNSNGELQ